MLKICIFVSGKLAFGGDSIDEQLLQHFTVASITSSCCCLQAVDFVIDMLRFLSIIWALVVVYRQLILLSICFISCPYYELLVSLTCINGYVDLYDVSKHHLCASPKQRLFSNMHKKLKANEPYSLTSVCNYPHMRHKHLYTYAPPSHPFTYLCYYLYPPTGWGCKKNREHSTRRPKC